MVRTLLPQAIEELDQEEIRTKLNKENINFNPTAARWEHQIKTRRKVLAGLMEEYAHCRDEESFQILICEVLAIINSRPLITVPGERKNLEPLIQTTT